MRPFLVLLHAVIAVVVLATAGAASAAVPTTCPVMSAGSTAKQPPSLHSENGVLDAHFYYLTDVDSTGRTRFCFATAEGLVNPTLHVNPGDTLRLKVTNANPAPPAGSSTELISGACGDPLMTITAVNMHFHGVVTSPECHSDEVDRTVINTGETWTYSVKFPADEPAGVYWYHPHIHGVAEAAVQGGATGAIVVSGLEKFEPAVAGLPTRLLIVRDQTIPNGPAPGGSVPSWDISVNGVPILYPNFTPAKISMAPGKKELWRVANTSADTILDVQLQYDGAGQPLKVVALDGVPTKSDDGVSAGTPNTQTDILIPPAGRAEFIVTGPRKTVQTAKFVTLNIDTGPDGDNDPTRTLLSIQQDAAGADGLPHMPAATSLPAEGHVASLVSETATTKRSLYFSEVLQDPSNPAGPTNFFITVDGATPTLFDPNNPPAIVTHKGSIEDWTIENRALENHEFHIHQVHFLLLEKNGVAVPKEQKQFYDTFQVPYWSGSGPYPSITIRMDFRNIDVGEYVYHCHILGHEDGGMMAIIKVVK